MFKPQSLERWHRTDNDIYAARQIPVLQSTYCLSMNSFIMLISSYWKYRRGFCEYRRGFCK